MSLHDDQPLDQKEQGALARSLATPEADQWWAGLPPNTRRAIMNKLISALAKAESPRDIGTLSRSLMKADELDLKRQQGVGAGGIVNNTQINVGADLSKLTVEQLRALARDPDAE